jgi:glutamate-5-semialdehyde dehydrogenase
VCNAAETLLIHSGVAATFVPRILSALGSAGVLVRADERTAALAGAGDPGDGRAPAAVIEAAGEEDWSTEYLGPIIAVAVVDSVQEAVEHIGLYGSGHSEAIVTRDTVAARAFQLGVDAACVYVNASTRFTDGGEFGMGAEIGNSTQKLHARGPIGLRELCTYKYLVEGDGHVRD